MVPSSPSSAQSWPSAVACEAIQHSTSVRSMGNDVSPTQSDHKAGSSMIDCLGSNPNQSFQTTGARKPTTVAVAAYRTVILWLSQAVGCLLGLVARTCYKDERGSEGLCSHASNSMSSLWGSFTGMVHEKATVAAMKREETPAISPGTREGESGKWKVDIVSMLRARRCTGPSTGPLQRAPNVCMVCGEGKGKGGGVFCTHLGLPATPTPQWQKTPSTSAPNPN